MDLSPRHRHSNPPPVIRPPQPPSPSASSTSSSASSTSSSSSATASHKQRPSQIISDALSCVRQHVRGWVSGNTSPSSSSACSPDLNRRSIGSLTMVGWQLLERKHHKEKSRLHCSGRLKARQSYM